MQALNAPALKEGLARQGVEARERRTGSKSQRAQLLGACFKRAAFGACAAPKALIEKSPRHHSTKHRAGKHEAWQRVQLARHPKRPHTLDYIERVFTQFQEIHGDRLYGDDPAIVCGAAFSRNVSTNP